MSRQKPPEKAAERPPPQVMLFTPPLADAENLIARLSAALAAAPAAAVVARFAPADERSLVNRIKALAATVQAAGAALLVDGAAGLAVRGGADGVHMRFDEDALDDALRSLKPERIVGAGALKSRDAAMTAGEMGCDYVLFGEPAAGDLEEAGVPPLDAVVARVAWWSEIFEPPVVGFAARLDDVPALAAAGADFIALGKAVLGEGVDPAAAMREVAAAIAAPRGVP